jgi:hypothetical protein
VVCTPTKPLEEPSIGAATLRFLIKFACERNAFVPDRLGDPHCPDLETQGPLNARHDDGCCLVQAQTRKRVATLQYMASPVDIARLILSGVSPRVRSHPAGSTKAVGVLDGADIHQHRALVRRVSEDLTRTARNHPVRTICASPSGIIAVGHVKQHATRRSSNQDRSY